MKIWDEQSLEASDAVWARINERALQAHFVSVAGDNGHLILGDGQLLSFNRVTVDWAHVVRTVILWQTRLRERHVTPYADEAVAQIQGAGL